MQISGAADRSRMISVCNSIGMQEEPGIDDASFIRFEASVGCPGCECLVSFAEPSRICVLGCAIHVLLCVYMDCCTAHEQYSWPADPINVQSGQHSAMILNHILLSYRYGRLLVNCMWEVA